ncbi:lamin tail domain-containing protein [Streptomyces sp. NPDC005551]|uniref:lamin tail domain-containing protein n=1 Tax=unclassified Streptomyces TaxID=2593676 RepID=UPI0033FC9C3D
MSSRSSRRIAAAVLAAGAALGASAIPASADGGHHRDRVVISDVQYDSPGHDNNSNRSLNREWVDLTNTGRRGVNLDGWTLRSRDGDTYTFRHFRLEGRATVRVHTGFGHDNRHDVFQDRRTYVWDNRSDTATLRDDHGRRVDDESWGRRGGGHHEGGWHRGGGHHDGGGRDGGRHHGRDGGGRDGDGRDGGWHHGRDGDGGGRDGGGHHRR